MDKDVVVSIDTGSSEKTDVIVTSGGKKWQKTVANQKLKSQMVLPNIFSLLEDQGLQIARISAITCQETGSSYTGLRVGAAVANSLAFLLDIPVNGKRALVIPRYEEYSTVK